MCLAETEPGGPKRCDGHAESGFRDAQSKLTNIIRDQADLSSEIAPLEQTVLRHRTVAQQSQMAGREDDAQRHLDQVDRIEADLEDKRAKAKKLAAAKRGAISDLQEKKADYFATSRGLQELQADIDGNRATARDSSLDDDTRQQAADEAERLQALADRSKVRMDTEEQQRLENAQRHGWDYQIKETLPIASGPASGYGSSEEAQQRADRFAADRSISMVAQGVVSPDDGSQYTDYTVTIGNAEGKTVTVDYGNYSSIPNRDEHEPLESVRRAPSRSEVSLSMSRLYADQKAEPNFDKFMEQTAPGAEANSPKAYEESKTRWRQAARERARLKKVLGDEKFEELLSIHV